MRFLAAGHISCRSPAALAVLLMSLPLPFLHHGKWQVSLGGISSLVNAGRTFLLMSPRHHTCIAGPLDSVLSTVRDLLELRGGVEASGLRRCVCGEEETDVGVHAE